MPMAPFFSKFPDIAAVETRSILKIPDGMNETKAEKIGRNEICPCGSDKKYKKCCGGVKQLRVD